MKSLLFLVQRTELRTERNVGKEVEGARAQDSQSSYLSPSLLSWEVDQGLVLRGRQVVSPQVWFGEGVLVASHHGSAAS